MKIGVIHNKKDFDKFLKELNERKTTTSKDNHFSESGCLKNNNRINMVMDKRKTNGC
tara:strand:- start:7 stop:177 length:171 start_codon:yes stop_codon:yes gene_type:complete